MNEIEPRSGVLIAESDRSALSEFESGLRQARELLRKDDLNRAFSLLSELEACYLRGAEVFLLIGEVFRRRKQFYQAERYNTLYDILKANFGIIDKAGSRAEMREGVELHPTTESPISFFEEPLESQASLREQESDELEAFVPVTTAMAEELMRQCHYKRALQIYDRLLARAPEDASLQEAKRVAKKKAHEERVLEVFEVWLKNIQRMKSELTGEA